MGHWGNDTEGRWKPLHVPLCPSQIQQEEEGELWSRERMWSEWR